MNRPVKFVWKLFFLFWLFRGGLEERGGTEINIPEKIEIDTGGQKQ